MRYRILLFSFLFFSINSFAQNLRTQGTQIIDENGNPVLLKGMGLGGWMLMEGYMMQSSDVADTQHEFRERLLDLFGEARTDTFFDTWQENHVTRADIDSLASWGYNSVRVPMHYNLFTLPIQEESIAGENTWLTKGFTMLDNLLEWCEANEMYLILDLHAAPGGQGANAAISDYDSDLPSLWESEENKNKTIALWKKLADRYKDEPWIGGYDLLNEVNWNLPNENEDLRILYQAITTAIRTVDSNHIIFIEGNGFANDFRGLTPPWDGNMVYSFHKYWSENTTQSIQWVLDIRDEHNIPLWMGEGGENSNVWFRDAIKLFEDNNIGWSWWPMKRIETIVAPYSIDFSTEYKNILEYWRGNVSRPSEDDAFNTMMALANGTNSTQCDYQKDVIDAKIRQINSTETIPFANQQIPGIIYMSDYDLGRSGFAYYDVDDANYQLSSGNFQAWNSGWVYRNDGVDIEKNEDTQNSNGYHIGYISQNEWINYTINVSETGVYQMDIRLAALSPGGKFHLEIDGEPITQEIVTQSSGGWDQFITQRHNDIILEEGNQSLKFFVDGSTSFNISSLVFTKVGELNSANFEIIRAQTSISNNQVEIVLNQNLDKNNLILALQDLSLEVNGITRTITDINTDDQTRRTFKLTLEEELVYGDQIRLSYLGNSISTISDVLLPNFNQLEVKNNVHQVFQVPGRIEAEGFYNMLGVEKETTSDIGGGQNIGYTNSGDYVDYLVDASTAFEYDLKARVAAESNSGRVAFYIISSNGNQTQIKEMVFPVTRGWQTWLDVKTSLQLPSGRYTLRMKVINGGFNLNWLEFSFPDGDRDGINDLLDQCHNTPITDIVNNQGCSITRIANNNFTLRVENETCVSSDNGKIMISAEVDDDYTAILNFNGSTQSNTFTSSTHFSDLSSGNYSLCLQQTNSPQNRQCYTISVGQPSALRVNSFVNPDTFKLNIDLKGGSSYFIQLNDKQYKTTKKNIQIPLFNHKNKLTIKTDFSCQGIYTEELTIDNFPKVHPNPVSGDVLYVEMGISNKKNNSIDLYNLMGDTVYSKQNNGPLSIDVSKIPSGIYILKITRGNREFNYKIIKQ